MIKRNLIRLITIIVVVISANLMSCKKDITPKNVITTDNVYKDINNYKPILAKLYSSFALSGQAGPAGNPDISGIDEGFGNYLREYYNMQELTTDEAAIVWNDGTIHNLHNMNWNSHNEFITAMYNRIFYVVSLNNEFIRQTTDAKLSGNGITGANLALVKQYRAEARFLRALAYWHAIDLFGSVPFVTENDVVGVFFPKQKSRADIFNYIESELKAAETDMGAPRFEYGRADKAAADMLLAKLYINAMVYTGTDRSTDAITYANKVIADGYSLEPVYKNLFLADNNKTAEIIFPITFDGLHTTGYGGITYLIHAPVGGKMKAAEFGINGGWSGLRTTKQYVGLFTDATDQRAMFFKDGQNIEINDEYTFTDGYAVQKFRNITSTGAPGSDITGNFPDTDFPMFRLADAYLIYAEAVLRGGNGGSAATALQYVNMIRTRAYAGSAAGNITSAQFNLQFILDERGREFLFEMHRRTDLIRFGKFAGGDYIWAWKGGVQGGQSVDTHFNLMPIPSTDIVNNPSLKQNPGYN